MLSLFIAPKPIIRGPITTLTINERIPRVIPLVYELRYYNRLQSRSFRVCLVQTNSCA